jgi:hypothetical protein
LAIRVPPRTSWFLYSFAQTLSAAFPQIPWGFQAKKDYAGVTAGNRDGYHAEQNRTVLVSIQHSTAWFGPPRHYQVVQNLPIDHDASAVTRKSNGIILSDVNDAPGALANADE